MDENVEDCPVCLNTFNDTLRRPRTLPCGHTLCTPCINELKEQGSIMCPTCRASHTVPEEGQFPISYAIEGLVRRLRWAGLASLPPQSWEQTAPAPVTRTALKATAGLSRKTRSQLQEQEAKVLAAIRSCKEEKSQLAAYLTTLSGWGGRQQRLEDELQMLVDQSKSARELVRREEARVEGRQEEVERREQQLDVMLEALRTAVTRREACEVIEGADHLVEEESHRTKEYLGVFPSVHAVTTVARVAEASRAALQAAAAATVFTQAALGRVGTAATAASTAASSIADKLQAKLAPLLTARDLPLRLLKTEDLLSLTQPARSLVQADLVFAVQDVEGQSRQARISLENGRLHLHSLQTLDQQAPPPGAITLQMCELVPAAPPCAVFLDLAWPGSTAQRVVVSLPRDTPLGRQFMLLCSGQRGACYASTRLLRVVGEGQPGEYVVGGDYQTGDGKGGAALLPDLGQPSEYWKSGKAGAVGGQWCGDPAQGAQFGITTQDWQRGSPIRPRVFGEVVHGLQVVKEAARHCPITEVTVEQCGVLLLPQ